MREILFRGKRLDNGVWITGAYHEAGGRHFILPLPIVPPRIKVDPATVGQFTGLLDKHGKRIFEGDILDHHVQGNILVNRGVVNWDARNGRWAHQLNTMNPCFYMHNPDAFEVIGNIHDNPELLKEGDTDGKERTE